MRMQAWPDVSSRGRLHRDPSPRADKTHPVLEEKTGLVSAAPMARRFRDRGAHALLTLFILIWLSHLSRLSVGSTALVWG